MEGLDSIQKAIDRLEGKEGRVILAKGRHLSGPLTLPSDCHLYLEEGSELKFSDDFSLYPFVKTRWEGIECHALQSLIFAENASNISIGGRGIIDGRGDRWWSAYSDLRRGIVSQEVKNVQDKLIPLNNEVGGGSGGGGRETGFLRPSLIQFKNCTGAKIEGVTLRNSPFWNTHILYSCDILLKELSFQNPPDAPNSDGLDIDSSRDVTVEGCIFDVGDDCLCLKSGMDEDGIRVGKPTSRITVRNCTMRKGHGAVVIGSETSGGISDVTVENCRMVGTDRGIRVKTRRGRGGIIEKIRLKNLEMDGVAAPIVINMFYRCGALAEDIPRLKSLTAPLHPPENSTPVIRNIEISDISARSVRSSAAFFLGLPESPITGLKIKNFKARAEPGTIFEEPAMDLFETESDGEAVLTGFLKDAVYEGMQIGEGTGQIVKEIVLKEDV